MEDWKIGFGEHLRRKLFMLLATEEIWMEARSKIYSLGGSCPSEEYLQRAQGGHLIGVNNPRLPRTASHIRHNLYIYTCKGTLRYQNQAAISQCSVSRFSFPVCAKSEITSVRAIMVASVQLIAFPASCLISNSLSICSRDKFAVST